MVERGKWVLSKQVPWGLKKEFGLSVERHKYQSKQKMTVSCYFSKYGVCVPALLIGLKEHVVLCSSWMDTPSPIPTCYCGHGSWQGCGSGCGLLRWLSALPSLWTGSLVNLWFIIANCLAEWIDHSLILLAPMLIFPMAREKWKDTCDFYALLRYKKTKLLPGRQGY